MTMRRNLEELSTVCLFLIATTAACAQNFPNKPIRIVTSVAGGGLDFSARVLAQALTVSLNQTVIVDNRGSAGGSIPAEAVMRASADGHTLLIYSGSFWLEPLLRNNVSYDPVKDFSPITMVVSSPSLLVVHPALPAKSVAELISLARIKPGQLNFASSAATSAANLAAELFKGMAKIDIVRISYKGAGPAFNDLIGGHIQFMFPVAAAGMPHVKSGKLRALGVTSAQPSALAPGIPTVSASGLPGYEFGSLYGMFAPAKTPEAIISRLNEEIVRVLNRADIREKFLQSGAEVIGNSQSETAAMIKADIVKMGKVIRDAGIKED